MDKKTRDYFSTRVDTYDKLNSEKRDLERFIENINQGAQITYAELKSNNRIPGGARAIITESFKDGCRKRIGEIERLMEEI